jgi:hypothetical protein
MEGWYYMSTTQALHRRQKIVNKFVEDLCAQGFDLEIEGDFTEYLGIQMEEPSDGSRVMSQAGLIQKVIEYADCNPAW